eukprot:CAMPEP_0180037624 /NCGR_PEP_ID=MMETSP0984-20121128/31684_1 /TAXON_ID=483367 /ORGANISM="non described non described, Strain CCMP 2436" /LENGTH=167 /DNA_ID=CAMNT_0021964127 /DNA_START=30 /DNA_END=529 /DNA_ORIENTATION=-
MSMLSSNGSESPLLGGSYAAAALAKREHARREKEKEVRSSTVQQSLVRLQRLQQQTAQQNPRGARIPLTRRVASLGRVDADLDCERNRLSNGSSPRGTPYDSSLRGARTPTSALGSRSSDAHSRGASGPDGYHQHSGAGERDVLSGDGRHRAHSDLRGAQQGDSMRG